MTQYMLAATHFSAIYPPSQATSKSVVTNRTGLPVLDAVDSTDVDLEHASSSTCIWTPETGHIIARVINDRRTLELIRTEDDSQPVRFHLTSPLRILSLPGLLVEQSSSSLHVLLVTDHQSLYRLSYPLPDLFTSSLLPDNWCKEYLLKHNVDSGDGPVHIIDPATVLIGLKDGGILRVEQTKQGRPEIVGGLKSYYDDNWREYVLRPSSIYNSLTSFLPFTGGTSAVDNPSQILSLDSFSPPDLSGFVFSVSRDRRLRVWSTALSVCVRVEDLPASTSRSLTSSASPSKAGKVSLLPPNPTRLIRAVLSTNMTELNTSRSSVPHCLVVFTPTPTSPDAGGFFSLYSFVTDATKHFQSMALVGYRLSSKETERCELRDYVVSEGKIWALWDQQGRSLLECGPLDYSSGTAITSVPWTQISMPEEPDLLSNGFKDEALDSTHSHPSQSLSDLYLSTLLTPNLFSPLTLQTALKQYRDSLLVALPSSSSKNLFAQDFESITEGIVAVVGSTLRLGKDSETGNWLWDAHRRGLKKEWESFMVRCTELERAARWPLALAIRPGSEIMVLDRERIGVVVEVDDASLAIQTSAVLAKLTPRLRLLRLCHNLAMKISPRDFDTFKDDILETVRSPVDLSPEDLCEAIYVAIPSEDDRWLVDDLSVLVRSFSDLSKTFKLTLDDLINTAKVEDVESYRSGELQNAFVTSYLSAMIGNRLLTALKMILLLVVIGFERADLVPDLPELLDHAFSIIRSLSLLDDLARRPGGNSLRKSDTPSSEDDFTTRFSSLRVSALTEEGTVRNNVNYSFLHTLLPSRAPNLDVRSSAHLFLRSSGLLQRRTEASVLSSDAIFLNELRTKGHLSVVVNIAEWYPKSPAICYVLGRALLDLKRGDEAADILGQMVPQFADRTALTKEDADALSRLFPAPPTHATMSFCYRQMASWFEQAGFLSNAIAFWQRSIETSSLQTDVRDLWYKVSGAQIDLGRFDDAYTTLVTTPYVDEQENTIRKLVEEMCDRNQSDKLTRMSFAGLQNLVEDFLEFKARNHNPFDPPDYSSILYAWHVYRGNYRGAGAAMYHHGRRLDVFRSSHDKSAIAIKQAHCYLAAVNCMSLIDPRHGWVAITIPDSDPDHEVLLTQYIPSDMFTPGMRRMQIVQLDQIRRDYALALARLELFQRVPQLLETSVPLSTDDIVATFMQHGLYDLAFSTAASLDVDMTEIFQHLTTLCVSISSRGDSDETVSWLQRASERFATWEGTMADKAWRYLRLSLERYDTSDYRYHKAVLERILGMEGSGVSRQRTRVPSWMISFFEEHHPEHLIRTCLRYTMVKDAITYTMSMIRRSNNKLNLAPRKQASLTWLPYLLIDEVISIASQSKDTQSSARALRRLVNDRIEQVEKLTRTLVTLARERKL